jgi:proteic killer suppression protein
MIKSFKHGGLQKFYETGSKAGIIPAHAKRLRIQLSVLDVATKPNDMDRSGWGLHPLTGS